MQPDPVRRAAVCSGLPVSVASGFLWGGAPPLHCNILGRGDGCKSHTSARGTSSSPTLLVQPVGDTSPHSVIGMPFSETWALTLFSSAVPP